MSFRRLLSILLVAFMQDGGCGCAPVPVPRAQLQRAAARCVTACDMRADIDEGDCRALINVEAQIIHAYASQVPEFQPGYASCVALGGYTIKVHNANDARCIGAGWFDSDVGACVIGTTRTHLKLIEVVDSDWSHNALAHEIGHALDHEYKTEQGGHCGWEARGLKRAIFLVTGEPDLTTEFCEQ